MRKFIIDETITSQKKHTEEAGECAPEHNPSSDPLFPPTHSARGVEKNLEKLEGEARQPAQNKAMRK